VGNLKRKSAHRVSRLGSDADWFAAWSPDGTGLAYTERRPHVHSSIVVVDAANGQVDSVIPFKRPTWVVAWRPGS
jgi:Tol biopolymer transport system component